MKNLYAIIDCNNFYVSCERLFNPVIANKPTVVLSNNDGCIISRSNEAKALGIKMGEPYFKAEKIIKQHSVAVYSSNYALYGDISARVMQSLESLGFPIEIYSIDEAFLMLPYLCEQELIIQAKAIQQRVKQWTGIPVSIGIATSKTLAKIANYHAKKTNGIMVIANENKREEILKHTPVAEIWGVGRKWSKSLQLNGISTAYDLSKANDGWVRKNYNILMLKTMHELQGTACIDFQIDNDAKKSITVSRSFSKPIATIDQLKEALVAFASRACEKLRKSNQSCKNIIVYIRNSPHKDSDNFYANSAHIELAYSTDFTPEIIKNANLALENIFKRGYFYKKLGIILTCLSAKKDQPQDLFDTRNHTKDTKLMQAFDIINKKQGSGTVIFASQGIKPIWQTNRNMMSAARTTKWEELLVVK